MSSSALSPTLKSMCGLVYSGPQSTPTLPTSASDSSYCLPPRIAHHRAGCTLHTRTQHAPRQPVLKPRLATSPDALAQNHIYLI